MYIDFNPRFRKGSDVADDLLDVFDVKISIHASAKEATLKMAFFILFIHDFNPRFRKGSDGKKQINTNGKHGFQSTLPQRKRLSQLQTQHH